MKEDVLEQVVEDYLQLQGYFTMHNVRFRPSPDHPEYESRLDSVASDIDVLGIDPRRAGPERLMVVSCKAWQTGFRATALLAQLRGEAKNPKRPVQLMFRELWIEKWALAFRDKVEELTGTSDFTYCLAVTKLTGNHAAWAEDSTIRARLGGNPFRFLTLAEMWETVLADTATAPAPSEIGRLAQLLRAAGVAGQVQSGKFVSELQDADITAATPEELAAIQDTAE